MKNIKDKIFAILSATVMLVSSGNCADSCIQPVPIPPDISKIENKMPQPKIPPTQCPESRNQPKLRFRQRIQLY